MVGAGLVAGVGGAFELEGGVLDVEVAGQAGLELVEDHGHAAVTEAGSLDQDDVVDALDHASIAHGPGGPATMVPGEHHVRMNMYIAQARNGRFEVVENLGIIDPKESLVAA